MRRMLWRLAYPFALAAHRWFGASYTWVNVGRGAWHTPSTAFDPLWHWRWYGTPIDSMPPSVNLCGIVYRVSVAEGLVLFIATDGMSGNRMEFTRDPHDQHDHLWLLSLGGVTPATHVQKAYEWVKAVFGGSFDKKRPPLRQANAIEGVR